MDINIYKYILTRQDVPDPLFSVHKLLEAYGYADYANIACNRIANSCLIDGEHVQIDFTNTTDLLVDYRGMVKCEEILSGYICDIDELEDYAHDVHGLVRANNEQLMILKDSSIKDLFKMLCEIMKSYSEEVKRHDSRLKRMILLEIISRSPINSFIQRIRRILSYLYCMIRYANIMLILKRFVKENTGSYMEDKG